MIKQLKLQSAQKGVSLISLMIGAMISLMTVGALFVLFQQSTVQSQSMREDLNLEGQVATVLLTLQQDMQSAGFGINDASIDTFEIIENSGLYSAFWRYQISDTATEYHCRGFEEEIDANNRLVMRWLDEIDCLSTANLESSLWAANKKQIALILEGEEIDADFFEISETTGNCSQFSQGDIGEHTIVTVSMKNSIYVDDGSSNLVRDSHSFQYCLTNT